MLTSAQLQIRYIYSLKTFTHISFCQENQMHVLYKECTKTCHGFSLEMSKFKWTGNSFSRLCRGLHILSACKNDISITIKEERFHYCVLYQRVWHVSNEPISVKLVATFGQDKSVF